MAVIFVDDQDPSIQYVGHWAFNGGSLEYNHTIHGGSSIGSQAIFKFRGSSISVFGTLKHSAAEMAPTASFNIDESGAKLFTGKPSENKTLSRQNFYSSPKLDPFNEHTLVITVVDVPGTWFWVDYFEIVREDAVLRASDVPSSSKSTTPDHPGSSTATLPSLKQSPSTPLSTQSTGPAMTIAGQSLQSPSNSSGSSLLTPSIILAPTINSVIATTTQLQSSLGTPASQSRGTIIGIAVGSVVGGLLLLVVVLILFFILRRKVTANKAALSDRRVTAFYSSAVHPNTITTSPTSPGGYGLGAGYVVRGGLSGEKSTKHQSSEGQRENDAQRISNNFVQEALPAYQSEFGDTIPPRRSKFGR